MGVIGESIVVLLCIGFMNIGDIVCVGGCIGCDCCFGVLFLVFDNLEI